MVELFYHTIWPFYREPRAFVCFSWTENYLAVWPCFLSNKLMIRKQWKFSHKKKFLSGLSDRIEEFWGKLITENFQIANNHCSFHQVRSFYNSHSWQMCWKLHILFVVKQWNNETMENLELTFQQVLTSTFLYLTDLESGKISYMWDKQLLHIISL